MNYLNVKGYCGLHYFLQVNQLCLIKTIFVGFYIWLLKFTCYSHAVSFKSFVAVVKIPPALTNHH